MCPRTFSLASVVWLLITLRVDGVAPAGAAKVDITPRQSVQLVNVKTPEQSQGVGQRLYARALALGVGREAVVLMSFDGIGVPASLANDVARRLKDSHGLTRAQVSVCATHTHWAPHLTDLLPNIYGGPLPKVQQKRVDAYTNWLKDRLVEVSRRALENRRLSDVSWTIGRVGFAVNRRLETGGQLIRDEEKGLMVTWNPNGPVDHDLPVLMVRDAISHALTAIHFTYACHNVALTGATAISGFTNSIHGDWAGLAQEEIEQRHPDCVAICTIGCGGDQRPVFCGGVAVAEKHAHEIADEVDRLLDKSDWRAVSSPVKTKMVRAKLPLEELQPRDDLQRFAGDQRPSANVAARAFLARVRLAQPSATPADVPFVVQSWRFLNGPVMLFLSGEVCIDYQLRIKRKFGDGVWPIAYANSTPGYIVSKRMLEKGGYEAGNSQFYYGWLRPLKPEVEEWVMDAVADAVESPK